MLTHKRSMFEDIDTNDIKHKQKKSKGNVKDTDTLISNVDDELIIVDSHEIRNVDGKPGHKIISTFASNDDAECGEVTTSNAGIIDSIDNSCAYELSRSHRLFMVYAQSFNKIYQLNDVGKFVETDIKYPGAMANCLSRLSLYYNSGINIVRKPCEFYDCLTSKFLGCGPASTIKMDTILDHDTIAKIDANDANIVHLCRIIRSEDDTLSFEEFKIILDAPIQQLHPLSDGLFVALYLHGVVVYDPDSNDLQTDNALQLAVVDIAKRQVLCRHLFRAEQLVGQHSDSILDFVEYGIDQDSGKKFVCYQFDKRDNSFVKSSCEFNERPSIFYPLTGRLAKRVYDKIAEVLDDKITSKDLINCICDYLPICLK